MNRYPNPVPTPAASPANPVSYRVAWGAAGVSCWVLYPYGVKRPLRHVRRHSSALEYGYVGSGPTDLALSILADHVGHLHVPSDLSWAFAIEHLGPEVLDRDEFDLSYTLVAAWLATRQLARRA